MYISKWPSLAAAGALQLVAGAAYTFSLYSASLKEQLHLSQPQLQGVGSALLCGGLFAWAPGLVYDFLMPYHKLGPRVSAGFGVLFHFVGYGVIWAMASGRIAAPYWIIVAAGLVASNSLLWLDTTAVVTSMRNFPNERGSIAGILKTFLGLSASILSTIYATCFTPNGVDFLLFLALAPAALGVVAAPFINHVPDVEENETAHGKRWLGTEQRLLAVGGIVGLLLVYQLATALAGQVWGLTQPQKVGVLCVALLLLLATLVMFFAGVGGLASKAASLPESSGGGHQVEPLLPPSQAPASQDTDGAPLHDDAAGEKIHGGATRQWNLRQCVLSPEYWILWTSMYIGIGSGFTFLNNLGQHVEALGGQGGGQEVYVLLFATFNCLGRMVCGFGSEWLLHKFAVPRTAMLLAVSISTACLYAVVATAGLKLLLPLAMLAGLAFGGHWALMPSCTSELFGSTHFAANQSIIHLATAVGAFTLSTELAGNLFQNKGEEHGDPKGTCYGHDCFRAVYLTIAGLAFLQSLLSLTLYLKSRPLYRTIHCNLQRFDEETST